MADLEYIVLNGEKLAIKDNRVNDLSTVASTGSYNDLTNKPNIQTITYNSETNTLVIS